MLRRLAIRNARFLTKNLSTGASITSSSTPPSHPHQKTRSGQEATTAIHNNKIERNDFYLVYRSSFRNISSEAETPKNQIRGGGGGVRRGDDDHAERAVCPGCGIRMQNERPKAPGFFLKPPAAPKPKKQKLWVEVPAENAGEVIFLDPDAAAQKFKPFDEEEKRPQKSEEKSVVCARCHSLRSYGRVKDESAENLLPDFDFDATVGARLMRTTGSRSTVLMVVDALDFDGSFPRRAAALLSRAVECGGGDAAWRQGRPGNVSRIVVVATKLDLLPSQVTPERLEKWVRQRSHLGGAVKVQGVHLVSAHRGWGIDNLALYVRQMTGPRGNVWVIGAQNAGKSTLINAMGKFAGGSVTLLTEAPVPGTTLGIIRVDGILLAKAKLYDTPGILHPYQISTRLNREEQNMVQIRKQLKPRTYRLKVGQSVHVGGLMRVDIENASVETIYLTVWASPLIPLHLGKVENADMIKEKHFGLQLQPPISRERVSELGEWDRSEFQVSGNSWDFNSMDIATAGLGWVSVGLKGVATLAVWTYEGVDVTLRNALILDKARFFETPGFTVSNIVSKADKNRDLRGKKNKDSKEKEYDDSEIEIASEI